MAKKKKKVSKAEAAARKDVNAQTIAKERSREVGRNARAMQQKVQKEKSKSPLLIIVVGSVLVLAIFLFAWVFTVGPGFLTAK